MAVCAACGAENRDAARFCDSCGGPLAELAQEQRKTVTVVFCDLVGSTALGESRDPEAVRRLLVRYFERMRAIIERHGGTVAKFIGDAVVAVFGAPVAHEDDALRALRAALEMRQAVPELGLEARLGVNTGEVVTSNDDLLVTGDAVNVAARFQQAAAAGEILVGAETVVLAGAAAVEQLEPLAFKGLNNDAFDSFPRKLVGEFDDRIGRRLDAPNLRDATTPYRGVRDAGAHLSCRFGDVDRCHAFHDLVVLLTVDLHRLAGHRTPPNARKDVRSCPGASVGNQKSDPRARGTVCDP